MIHGVLHSWDETNADGHEFGFDGCNVHGLGVGLFYDMIVRPRVGDH